MDVQVRIRHNASYSVQLMHYLVTQTSNSLTQINSTLDDGSIHRIRFAPIEVLSL